MHDTTQSAAAVTFALFPDLGGSSVTHLTTTMAPLADWLRGLQTQPNKAACPLISMNRYGEVRTGKKSLRTNGNILEATGVIGDYDAGAIAPADAAGMLAMLGIEAIVVTTPSHGIKGNRWRVIVPLSAPTTIEARHVLLGRLNGLFGGVLAGESFTASQAFYVGRVAGVPYEVHYTAGVPLDRMPGIEQVAIVGPAMAQPRAATGGADEFAMIPKRADDIRRVQAALAGIPNDSLDWERWNKIGMAIYAATAGSDEGLELWREWSDRCPGGDDSVDARWKHFRGSPPTNVGMGTLVYLAREAAPPPSPATPLPPALPPIANYGAPLAMPPGGNGRTTLEAAVMIAGSLRIAFDEFKQRVVLLSPPPWNTGDSTPRDWTDADTIETQTWLQGQLMKPGKDTVADAVTMIANRNRNHPVRNYLDRLVWDQVPRLPGLFSKYFGARDTEYTRTIGPMFMIAAVARIYQPGCKVDNMVILEGTQGLRKSTAAEQLIPELSWFTDELPDVSNKDAAMQLHGAWIVEVAELDAISRAEVTAVKKFITRRVDRYRPPFGRATIDVPRSCVFVGSVNPGENGYLKDPTGNRRYWPVTCGRCAIEDIRADRDQLWAEAAHRYQAGQLWYLPHDEEDRLFKPEQEARVEVDPWEDIIRERIDGSTVTAVTANRIALDVLHITSDKLRPAHAKKIAEILRRLGWSPSEKKQRMGGGAGPSVVWYRDPTDPRIHGVLAGAVFGG